MFEDYVNDPITIQDLYPDLSPEEQAEAERLWIEYLRIVRRIFDRLEREGKVPKMLYRRAEKRRRQMKRSGLED